MSSLATPSLLSLQMTLQPFESLAVPRVFIWLKSSNQRRNSLLNSMLHAAGGLELLSWNSSIQSLKNWRRIWYHPAGWWFIRDFWVGPTSSVQIREEWVNTRFLSAPAQPVPTLWLQRCEWEMSSGLPYCWEAAYSRTASEHHKVAQSNV